MGSRRTVPLVNSWDLLPGVLPWPQKKNDLTNVVLLHWIPFLMVAMLNLNLIKVNFRAFDHNSLSQRPKLLVKSDGLQLSVNL